MAFHVAFHAMDRAAPTVFHTTVIAVMNADHAIWRPVQIALAAMDMPFHTAFHAITRAVETVVHTRAIALMNADHAI
jgi:hypothetical protein